MATVPDPYRMTREEFLNPPEIKARPGYRVLFHATDNEALESIARAGLQTRYSKSPPKGSIWAAVDPDNYSRTKAVVAFQVPKDDPLIEYVTGGGQQAIIFRDIEPRDILALDPVIHEGVAGGQRLSQLRGSKYAGIYWDEQFGVGRRTAAAWASRTAGS